jgi:defect in organelle trafficking protein DotC
MDAINLEQLQRAYESRPVDKNSDYAKQTGANTASQNSLDHLRQQALQDVARSIGIKHGLNNQLKNINNAITQKEVFLEKIYNFTPYLIYNRVVPPVITEARDLYNQDSDVAVRLSGAIYKIERQARLVSVAPNWREYLNFPVMKVNIEPGTLLPKNAQEKTVWSQAMSQGWLEGTTQANDMLAQSIDRLNRDYIGIIRFHRFAKEGKVTLPVLSESKFEMTKNAEKMVLDEQLLRLTVLPDFQTTMKDWKVKIIGRSAPLPKKSVQVVVAKPPEVKKEVKFERKER